jgi:hypothetical protein
MTEERANVTERIWHSACFSTCYTTARNPSLTAPVSSRYSLFFYRGDEGVRQQAELYNVISLCPEGGKCERRGCSEPVACEALMVVSYPVPRRPYMQS